MKVAKSVGKLAERLADLKVLMKVVLMVGLKAETKDLKKGSLLG